MASVDDFYISVYEYDYVENFMKWKEESFNYKYPFLSDEDHNKLKEVCDKINEFDFDKLNNLASKYLLQFASRKHLEASKTRKEYMKLYKKYKELGEIDMVTTGDNIIHLSVVIFPFGDIKYQSPHPLYHYLGKITVLRDGKKYKIDDEMILDIFTKNTDLYRESLMVNEDLDSVKLGRFYSSMIDRYMNQIHPLKHRLAANKKMIECQESQNGILRGLCHKIGYTGYHGKEPEDYLMDIINSGYLEIQFKERNPNSGVFVTMINNNTEIKNLYGPVGGIYLMISLSALDDFDYWCGPHTFGARKLVDFYKGICHKCDEEFKKYSAAERCNLLQSGDTGFYELMFASDINIKRYVEEIIVTDDNLYNQLMSSTSVPAWTKSIMTNKEDKKKIYRKNCKGETPEIISDKLFKRLVKKIKNRKLMDKIPKVDYKSINIRRKSKLIYDPLDSAENKLFPMMKK